MPAKGYALPDDQRRMFRLFVPLSDFELCHLDSQLTGEHKRERAPYIRGLILREIPLASVPSDYHKHVDNNRPHKIEVQLNVFELATLIAATMVSVVKENAPYARSLIMGTVPRLQNPAKVIDDALLVQLSKIGTNINQIARDVNTGRIVEPTGFQHAIDALHTVLAKIATAK